MRTYPGPDRSGNTTPHSGWADRSVLADWLAARISMIADDIAVRGVSNARLRQYLIVRCPLSRDEWPGEIGDRPVANGDRCSGRLRAPPVAETTPVIP